MNKPNCYKCKYRESVPGSAHSSCIHPANKRDDPANEIMGMFASVGRVAPVKGETTLNVKGDPHGIKSGWFNFPYNFDPCWLEECDGFTEKEESK